MQFCSSIQKLCSKDRSNSFLTSCITFSFNCLYLSSSYIAFILYVDLVLPVPIILCWKSICTFKSLDLPSKSISVKLLLQAYECCIILILAFSMLPSCPTLAINSFMASTGFTSISRVTPCVLLK